MRHLSFAVLVITAVSAMSIVKRQAVNTFGLPSGAELIVGTFQSSIDCASQKGYGYFADPAAACKVFHICVPIEEDRSEWLQYTFICGNQTVFDQEKLICDYPNVALPCDQAKNFYSINDLFGQITQQFSAPKAG